jgi:hypothetical protein
MLAQTGVVGREGVALDVTGVGDEGSAVKLKSFYCSDVCTECCSLSLRDSKCSKRIFLAADGLILGEALGFLGHMTLHHLTQRVT